MDDFRKKVMIVDDNAANLTMGRNLLKSLYKVYPASSAKAMFEILEQVRPDLILLDVEMPETDGYGAINELKANQLYADIPVIFLTAKSDETSELLGFGLGAVDYVAKPFSMSLLQKRIDNQLLIADQKKTIQKHADDLSKLVQKRTKQVFQLQYAMLHTIAGLIEFRDRFTGTHIFHTQSFLEILIDEAIQREIHVETISQWDLLYLLPSAALHDVGKIGVPDAILNKPAKLTPEEFEIIKTHVSIGTEVIKQVMKSAVEANYLQNTLNIVGAHHEKWDGTGYPAGLKGEAIPLEGRLMALADVYEALTSDRPYKRAFTHDEAKKIIEEGSGTHFDPTLVEVFLAAEKRFEKAFQKQ